MRAGMLGELRSPEELLSAAAALRRRGWRKLDAFTPYPIAGLEEALGRPRSPLGFIVLALGCSGAAFGYLFQLFCNAYDYPLNVGGRPLNSAPAFIPITFESAVLAAGVGGFFAFLLLARLPDLANPIFDVPGFERATVDAFFLGIDERDPNFDEVSAERDLRDAGAFLVARARRRSP